MKQNLTEIIAPRYEELLFLVQAELRRSGYEDLIAAGIVITGGSSKAFGLVELAEEIFHMPVRLGSPYDVSGLADIVSDPAYSTGVGLILYGKDYQQGYDLETQNNTNEGMFERMKSWFSGGY